MRRGEPTSAIGRAAARVLAAIHETNRETGVAQRADSQGGNLERDILAPPADLSAERQRRAELEVRRARVLANLEANPDLERAWLATTMPDGTTVLTVAIRGTGSAELSIEPGRFDPFRFIEITRDDDE